MVASAAQEAVHFLGPSSPCAAVVYLATAPKSNELYTAYAKAKEDAHEFSADPVPLYLRNPVTSLMKKAGYGNGYSVPSRSRGPRGEPGVFPAAPRGQEVLHALRVRV